MKKIGEFIVKSKYALTVIFVGLVCVCAFYSTKVNINYDMLEYLDKDSESTVAISKMEEEFGSIGSATIMVEDISADSATGLLTKIESVEGVSSVVFDAANVNCYDNNKALYQIFLTSGDFDQESYDAIDDIKDILDTGEYKVDYSGNAVISQFISNAVMKDMNKILLIACLIVLVILLLTSTSWIDPLVFGIVVAGSIIMNMGTNVWFPKISFITQAISAVMQLALAMDYSIILLNSYNSKKKSGQEPKEAMKNAIAVSFKPVSSSAVTTISGLVALVFMSFSIGFDIGMVLAKGIVFSLLCVFLFFPGLLLMFNTLIEKTKHRSIFEVLDARRETKISRKIKSGKMPKTIESFQYKTRIMMPIITLCVIVIGAILNFNSIYSYDLESSSDPNASVVLDQAAIEKQFGIQNNMVIIVDADAIDEQKEINDYIVNYKSNGVSVVNSNQSMVGNNLYENLSATEVSAMFNLPVSSVEGIFVQMGKTKDSKVQVLELLDYINDNDVIKAVIDASQDQADANYTKASTLFTSMNSATMLSTITSLTGNNSISIDLINTMYTAMGVTETSPYDLLTYINDNDYATNFGLAGQAELDSKALATSSLTDAATLAAAQGFVTAYQNGNPGLRVALEPQYNAAVAASTLVAKDSINTNPKFSFYQLVPGATDTLYGTETTLPTYKLVLDASASDIATKAGVNEEALLESMVSTADASVNYSYTDILTPGSGFSWLGASDATKAFVDGAFQAYSLDKDTQTINQSQLINFLVNYDVNPSTTEVEHVANVVFGGIQDSLNEMALAITPESLAEGAVLMAAYNETDNTKDLLATYKEKYVSLATATASLTKEQALANASLSQFLTSDIADAIYGTKTSMYVFEILQAASASKVAEKAGAAIQAMVTDKLSTGEIAMLNTKGNAEAITAAFAASGTAIPLNFVEAAYTENDTELSVYTVLERISKNKIITKAGTSLEEKFDETYANVTLAKEMFIANGYTRLVYNLDLDFSDQAAFDSVTEIKDTVNGIISENYLVSASSTYKDIQDVYNTDMVKVNLISFIAILLICILTFGSPLTAVLLTALIQGSIWISMGINTMTGDHIFFVSYLVVMCIQMGATVDYGILITTKYIAYRKTMSKKAAISKAMRNAIPTIFTSGSILVLAALIIGLVSNVSVISGIGMLLSKGCLISIVLIILAWPQILMLADGLIEKTTLHAKFVHKDESDEYSNRDMLTEE